MKLSGKFTPEVKEVVEEIRGESDKLKEKVECKEIDVKTDSKSQNGAPKN